MKIALCQINPTVGALRENAALIERYAWRAAEAGAEAAVFPELAICGYPPEDLLLKDHFVDDCMALLGEVAVSIPSGLVCLVGCPWDDQPKEEVSGIPYNAAVVLEAGRVQAVYRKMLLPNYGVFDEKRIFAEGTEPGLLEVGGRTVCIQICEDSWFVDAGPNPALSGRRVDLVLNLSASPYQRGKLSSRVQALSGLARHLDCPLLYCNLVGGQDELVFDGASLALDRRGDLVARARQFDEDLLVVDLDDPAAGRREPLLDDPAEVYAALTTGLRDYVNKSNFQQVLVALSGGVDSALVGALAVDALGPNRVVGLTLPSRYSSPDTRSDAQALAERLGIAFHVLPIQPLYDHYLAELQPFWPDREPDTTEENLQARIRGNLVMAFSNKFGWLVLTTGNKSEMAVGYCTLYGDMVGGFAVIKDVPKTLVWDLCRWRNSRPDGPVIPPSTIDRPPSAELRPDQQDTDSLPPYPVLDAILERYVERDWSIDEMAADGLDPDLVERVVRMIDITEYKRRQAAPGLKITPKAFGRDRRLPIVNAYRDRRLGIQTPINNPATTP